jgi:hypothetical protein
MKNRFLLTIILAVITASISGQPDFRTGYVILNNSDTIFGKIDSRGARIMGQTCRFVAKPSDPVINYSPDDIIEYRFNNGKCYVSRQLENGEKVFLEYLINGKLNIYYYRDENGVDHYLIDKEGFPLKVIPYEEEIRETAGGTKFLYKPTIHIGMLQYYTNDAPDFLQEPIKIKKPDHNSLIDFAEKYHNKICSEEECIIYEKEMPLIIGSFEIVYGPMKLNRKLYDEAVASEFGPLIYLSMPRVNERFFFKTGLLVNPVEVDDEKTVYLKLPIQIQYQYSHYRLMPKIFLGINTYFSKKNAALWRLASGGGVDYRFSDNISLTGSLTAEFKPLFFEILDKYYDPGTVSSPFLSYTFCFGFRFTL